MAVKAGDAWCIPAGGKPLNQFWRQQLSTRRKEIAKNWTNSFFFGSKRHILEEKIWQESDQRIIKRRFFNFDIYGLAWGKLMWYICTQVNLNSSLSFWVQVDRYARPRVSILLHHRLHLNQFCQRPGRWNRKWLNRSLNLRFHLSWASFDIQMMKMVGHQPMKCIGGPSNPLTSTRSPIWCIHHHMGQYNIFCKPWDHWSWSTN